MPSVTAEHAVRAVLFLARAYGGPAFPADEIAAAIGAPANYLSKTLNALTKAGILVSSAGRLGGFALAIPPDVLTLDRVIDVFEAAPSSTQCLLGNRPCDRAHPCEAHHRWTSITQTYRAALRSTTVSELLAGA